MTCSTCGRDNPGHLTFCQECGQRLGPRIAPPTPPIGLGGSGAYGAPAAAAAGAPPQPPPSFDALGATNAMSSPAAAAPSRGASTDRRCRICDTVNSAGLRYCTSCGSTLDPQAAAPRDPAPIQPDAHRSAEAAPVIAAIPSPAQAIVPMGVIQVAASGASGTANAQPSTRICSRCKGAADAAAQFCKFCGNALPEATGAAPTPSASERVEGPRTNGSAEAAKPAGRPSYPPRAESRPPPGLRPAGPAPSGSPIGPVAPGASAAGLAVAGEAARGAPHTSSGAAALAATPSREPARGAHAPALVMPSEPPRAHRAPAAEAPQRGRLVVIAKSGADGPSYPFGDVLDIGRTEGNVIVGEDPYLSPRHVRIAWASGKIFLRDLGSTNGVYLRLAASRDAASRRSSESPEIAVPLVDQDLILVGQQVLRFDILRENEGGFGPAQEHGTLLFGSPAAPRYARLCQRTVEGIARDIYYVRKMETVLGRESGDVVFTEDPFLSRRHAAIRLLARDAAGSGSRPPAGEARFALVDLGSSNGTFLRIRSDVELASGDHFRVGQQLFRVDFDQPRARARD